MPGHLATLDRKQLVHPTAATVDDDTSYRFHHILIRDAAYNGLLKRARASLHERFVDVGRARQRGADRELEFQEILGYHLEQAYRYLAELGPLDEHGVRARRSARPNGWRRRADAPSPAGDMPATANLLRRAAAVLPPGRADRVASAHRGRRGAQRRRASWPIADEVLELARREAGGARRPGAGGHGHASGSSTSTT